MLGRTLLTTAAAVAMALIFVTPVRAADQPVENGTGAAASSYLHTVRPTALRPGQPLVLEGTVENTGDEPLTNVQALPRWSTVQLETRAEIRRVSADPTLRWGLRHDEPYQVLAERLNPGEKKEFRLRIGQDMGFGNAGVYAVGVDIRGTLTDGERITLDTSRTVVPWFPDDDPPAVPIAMLWPVEAPPSLLPNGSLDNDALAGRISDDGSLDAIVEAGESAPVTWLVDPDVLDSVEALAEGDDGPAAAARSWRTAFNNAATDNLFLLPYARPDVEAMLAANPRLAARVMPASVEASREAAGEFDNVRTGVARPESGATSDDALSLLAESGVRTVVLSGIAVDDARHPLATVGTSGGDLDAILTDTGLDAALADAYNATNTDAGLLDFRQRWAAETAMAALDAAVQNQAPKPMAVAPPARWTPSQDITGPVMDTWTSLPWVQPVAIPQLSPPAEPASIAASPADTANALPADNIAAVAELRTAVENYTELLAEPNLRLGQALERAAVRATSTGWRDDPAAGLDYAQDITDNLVDRLDEVDVTVPESVTLSSRTGVFPLTVSNDLDEPVMVKLAIQAANPDRLRVDEVDERLVEPGARETVEVRAEAVTNGRVPITVQLVTRSGSPLGPATQTVVNATDYGTVGWFIIAGAGALFGAAIIRNMVRRRSGAAQSPVDEPAAGNPAGGERAAGEPPDVPGSGADTTQATQGVIR